MSFRKLLQEKILIHKEPSRKLAALRVNFGLSLDVAYFKTPRNSKKGATKEILIGERLGSIIQQMGNPLAMLKINLALNN